MIIQEKYKLFWKNNLLIPAWYWTHAVFSLQLKAVHISNNLNQAKYNRPGNGNFENCWNTKPMKLLCTKVSAWQQKIYGQSVAFVVFHSGTYNRSQCNSDNKDIIILVDFKTNE